MTREQAQKICAELRRWDNRPFVTADRLLQDIKHGKEWCTVVWTQAGERHDFRAYSNLGPIQEWVRGGEKGEVRLETLDGDTVHLKRDGLKSWMSIIPVQLCCSNCWRRYSKDERQTKWGPLCGDCYASEECPHCGGHKRPGSWECAGCRGRLLDGLVSGVADAFGATARKVDLTRSLEAGEWLDEETDR